MTRLFFYRGHRIFLLMFLATGLAACDINAVPRYDEEVKASW